MIVKRSRLVLGVANLVDCTAPLSMERIAASEAFYKIQPDGQEHPGIDRRTYAWIFADVGALARANDYVRKLGSRTWVNLDPQASGRVSGQLPH